MSEVMTSEAIIEAEWLLAEYWTKTRFAFQTKNGGWSDIDVLAYHPEKKSLVIAESKVRGSKKDVFAYTAESRGKYRSILMYDDAGYFDFIHHLPLLCNGDQIFSDFRKMVSSLTIQLVCNYAISEDLKAEVEMSLEQEITKFNLPCKASFKLDTTLDVISRVILAERDSKQNRRYGNQVLDIAREINRYFHANIQYAGSRKARSKIKQEITGNFLTALGDQ